jgi:hypothetical protein
MTARSISKFQGRRWCGWRLRTSEIPLPTPSKISFPDPTGHHGRYDISIALQSGLIIRVSKKKVIIMTMRIHSLDDHEVIR